MPEKYNIERDGAGQNISMFIKPPNSYIVWSILNMVFGALIFGVVGLIFSIKTKNRISEGKVEEARGSYEGAREKLDLAKTASKRALIFNVIGTFLILVGWILVIVLNILRALYWRKNG